MRSENNLIWMDLEMTGLDCFNDTIIEIATVITDAQLNELAVGPVIAVSQPQERLDAMDEWNQKHHGSSGQSSGFKRAVTLWLTLNGKRSTLWLSGR